MKDRSIFIVEDDPCAAQFMALAMREEFDGVRTVSNATEARQAVNALLDEGRKNIILNLGGVSYMDSAGIGELVACYKRAREKGVALKLLNPNGKVQDLLILTKLQEIFDIYRDEREALASF